MQREAQGSCPAAGTAKVAAPALEVKGQGGCYHSSSFDT